ncbi:MAG TPA: glutamate--tRNA ligase [bacterium]|nr:glutamate--tRNA ligase [bacterium]
MDKVRTRFAPSPTGYLHIGGARTALFNWLFARNTGGTFILRIEDTDLARSTDEAVTAILDSMKWLGLDWDEGPFYQSKRLDIYRCYAEQLLKQDKAYYSEPNEEGKRAIFFRMPHEKVAFDDLVYGRIEFDNALQKDLVIIKSDGMPTYNYACTIDDALMNITHIIRGDDHVSNTPKQIPLYTALGFPLPRFAHVPMILGEDKTRLSKRHGATSVGSYQEEGFLPEAMINYLVLLGWSPGDNREIMTQKEMVDAFTLDKASKKSAVFSMDKLKWMNAHYIKGQGMGELVRIGREQLERGGVPRENIDDRKLAEVIALYRDRLKIMKELVELGGFFFRGELEYKRELLDKFLGADGVLAALEELETRLVQTAAFDTAVLEQTCRELTAKFGLKNTPFFQGIRVAITGQTMSPGLFDTMVVLGRETVIGRLGSALRLMHESRK